MDTLYSDYEKIVPSEKLPDFLFHYFNLYRGIPWVKDVGENAFYDALQSTAKNYDSHKLFFTFLDWIFLKAYTTKNFFIGLGRDRKKIIFRPFKYFNITLGAKKYHNVGLIVHGRDRLVAMKHGMGYISTSDLDQHLLAYKKDKNITHLHRLIKKIERKLIIAKPDYVVLWNDVLPLERAIALASKKLGITTLEIHHGIFDEIIPMETGKIAD